MEVQEGAYSQERLIHSYVHLESLRESNEERMEAMVEGSLGASFHGGLMET
jgi:hypothetical protein